MKLTILGSGSPEAYVRRASSGYLLEVGKHKILFDCGGGVFDNLLRAGHKPSDITHIFFTHLHSDHMMDYARLVHAAWDEGGKPIKVFGPAPLGKITQGYFGQDGVLWHDLVARTELKPSQEVWVARGGSLPRPLPVPKITEISPYFTYTEDAWSLRSCAVPHAQPHLECLAFSLESEDKKFVYSGDAGICSELEILSMNADVLLHWCYRADGDMRHPVMHALTPTPSEIAKMALRVQAKRLLLTHFRVHMDASTAYAAAKIAAKSVSPFSGVVEDLDVYAI